MEQNPIFVENPQLKVVYGTSDGEFFYKKNDAENHAKKLSDKKVEPVYNTNQLEVAEEEVLEETTQEENAEEETTEEETTEEVTTEEVTTEEVTTEEVPDVETSSLDDRLRAFDPESTEYAEALDLFIDLKLVAASRKKVDVYAALSAAKSQLK